VEPPDVLPADAPAPDAQPDLPPPDLLPEDVTTPPSGPGPEFDPFCNGAQWDAKLTGAAVHPSAGDYLGYYKDFPGGTLECSKIIPPHPFHVKSLRVAFADGTGPARIRIMTTFGRSYPGGFPVITSKEANLTAAIEVNVSDPGPDNWVEVDLSDRNIFLEPTQHYMLVYEHLDYGPFLAIETVAAGDWSHGLIIVPDQFEPYGVDGNFRMQLTGDYFCAWKPEDSWFQEVENTPLKDNQSARAMVRDMNLDGHEDFIFFADKPVVYLGDGKLGFQKAPYDAFPVNTYPAMLVFGDLDNDGDPDAFAPTWITWDGDNDMKYIVDGDCNDADATIHPGAEEVPDNGVDDDCDGVADDGTSVEDKDQDGVSIADGDCNDNNPTVGPGFPEVVDSVDNDCDLVADEDFPNRILMNDGNGVLTPIESSGVEFIDPSSSAALGDGNADGVLDVYWGNWLVIYPESWAVEDRYAEGVGDGTFVEVTKDVGLWEENPKPCYGVTWNDYNNDGAQDIWVGNYQLRANYLWSNLGDGTFQDVAPELGLDKDETGYYGGHTYGGDWGDVDNDGDLDLFEPNLAHPRTMPNSDPSRFLVNQGAPTFTFVNKAAESGFIYDEGDVNAQWADWDNDGDLDLSLATLYTGHFSKLYRNDGPAGFADVTYQTNAALNDAVTAVWLDADEDGDLDLIIASRWGETRLRFLENKVGQDNNWVKLLLTGTTSNRDAVGARVTLASGGTTQMREVKGSQGHFSAQSTRFVHFGLGKQTAIDSVTVRWVGGKTETFAGVGSNATWDLTEGKGKAVKLAP
jgi:hypothetical protein